MVMRRSVGADANAAGSHPEVAAAGCGLVLGPLR